jgi:hypothetical protein
MDNPETLVTLGTQDTGQRQNKTSQKTKKIRNTDRTKTGGEHRCVIPNGKQFMPLVRHPQCYSKLYII